MRISGPVAVSTTKWFSVCLLYLQLQNQYFSLFHVIFTSYHVLLAMYLCTLLRHYGTLSCLFLHYISSYT
uniref:Uncharacterized protein n=1 Tax=Rhizophora mucronata TaxID=61149 RepID=A0A2P2IQ05_RHIMU